VGTQTVIDDNPKLDVRDWKGNNPIKVIIDQNNRIPLESQVFENQSKTIVFSKTVPTNKKENCIFESIDFEKNIGNQILQLLYKHQIQSIIIEGGQKTLQTFIDEKIWDEARIFIGTNYFKKGIKAPIIPFKNKSKTTIEEDELVILRNHD
jgi:diaminohydroxyphosphoribosylaminopyrimidine deaminase/5-amino-6-(5-phosphoribosylamino)uracil reductase